MVESSLEVFEDCTGIGSFRAKPKGAPAPLPGKGMDMLVQPVTSGMLRRISKDVVPVNW
jgi:hypothetical protein